MKKIYRSIDDEWQTIASAPLLIHIDDVDYVVCDAFMSGDEIKSLRNGKNLFLLTRRQTPAIFMLVEDEVLDVRIDKIFYTFKNTIIHWLPSPPPNADYHRFFELQVIKEDHYLDILPLGQPPLKVQRTAHQELHELPLMPPAAHQEPIIMHNLFVKPTQAGHWSPGDWTEFKPQYGAFVRGEGGVERIGLAFLEKELAGYFTLKEDCRFMLETPLWGEVLLRESYTKEWHQCVDKHCLCHKYEPRPGYNHELRIIKQTENTYTTDPILQFDLKHWPVNYVLCKCGEKPTAFYHTGEDHPNGFYCSKCNPAQI